MQASCRRFSQLRLLAVTAIVFAAGNTSFFADDWLENLQSVHTIKSLLPLLSMRPSSPASTTFIGAWSRPARDGHGGLALAVAVGGHPLSLSEADPLPHAVDRMDPTVCASNAGARGNCSACRRWIPKQAGSDGPAPVLPIHAELRSRTPATGSNGATCFAVPIDSTHGRAVAGYTAEVMKPTYAGASTLSFEVLTDMVADSSANRAITTEIPCDGDRFLEGVEFSGHGWTADGSPQSSTGLCVLTDSDPLGRPVLGPQSVHCSVVAGSKSFPSPPKPRHLLLHAARTTSSTKLYGHSALPQHQHQG